MKETKRMHPLMIPVSLIRTVKELFFLILVLFVFNWSSEALWVTIGRYLLFGYVLFSIVRYTLKWWRTYYHLTHSAIEIREGAMVLKRRHIPFDRIQNVQIQTPAYLRLFGVTSLKIETASGDEEASFAFLAITRTEAEKIEQALDQYKRDTHGETDVSETETSEATVSGLTSDHSHETKTIHFTPTKKELGKAFLLSASYLILFPIIFSFVQQLDGVLDIMRYLEEAYTFISDSWLLLTLAILVVVLISVLFGVVTTYLKYGRYEISSDAERIYITQGILTEKHFSIRKKNVQAIQMEQSILKRWLGITGITLINAGGDAGDSINSLYPFLPTKRAISLVSEMLPNFTITEDVGALPRKSLVARFCRFPWFWLIVTAVIFFFFKSFWWISLVLLVLTLLQRYINYRYSGFVIHDEFIQLQEGGWVTSTLVTRRQKVIELSVEQSLMKQRFGLASLATINRSKPIFTQKLRDIPQEMAAGAYQWYVGNGKQ
ncbi:PH domain-containing protein [Gracilibacillus timonensis]|uniref:PH domain-containing protein n=1 Tax=Gracilibacillus timonensis TaxID=1816696 RepID=UPI000826E432|nr:PH domain-containing protein [Gracilibacillus timonensis]